MKKTNKVLSVLLAVVMIFSCCGLVFANAASEADAAAAATAWNEAKRPHADVYNNISKGAADAAVRALDPAVAQLLKSIDLDSILYTDAVATAIIKLIHGLIPAEGVDIAMPPFGSLHYPQCTADKIINEKFQVNIVPEDFPGVIEYLATCTTLDSIGVIPFGVKDRDSFVEAVSIGCTGVGNTLKTVLGMYSWENSVGGLLDSLQVGKTYDWKTYTKTYVTNDTMGFTARDAKVNSSIIPNYYFIEGIIKHVLKVVDELKATETPVSYLLGILPGVATSFDKLGETLAPLLGSTITLAGVLYPELEKIGLTLPETDVIDEIKDMGTAVAAENCSAAENGFGVQINGDKTMVFAAIADYVAELLSIEGNVAALGKVVVGDYVDEDTYYGFVNAVKADNAALAIGYICEAIEEYIANQKIEEEPEGPFAWFFKLIQIITNFLKKVLGVK